MRALLILLLLSFEAGAATFYVDCSAGSNGTGTFASPFNALSSLVWATIETNNDDVMGKAGTTCTGALNVQASGTSGDRIEIGVYSVGDGSQITDGSARWTIDGNNAAAKPCEITSRSWVRVIGVDCKGSNTATDEGNAHIRQSDDIVWHYSTITAGTGTGRNGILINRGNRVDARYITANGFTQHGAFLYMPAAGTYTGISLQNSTFNGNALYGIRVQCDVSGITVPSLTIANNVATGNGATTNGWGFRSSCPLPNGSVTGNTLTGNFQDGIELTNPSAIGAVADYDSTGLVIADNDVSDNCQFGIHVISQRGMTISDNNAHRNGCNDAVDFGRGIEIVDNSGDRVTGTQALTLTAATGVGVTSSCASCAQFSAADIGKTIIAKNTTDPGAAIITAFTDTNTVTVTVLDDFPDTSVAAWQKTRSPYRVTITGNRAEGNLNYISDSSEGIGIALDDNVIASTVTRNWVEENEGRGIEIKGVGNTVTSNITRSNGTNFRVATTAGHGEIYNTGVETKIHNNTSFVNAVGTTGEKVGIVDSSPTAVSSTISNNVITGSGTAAIERVDTVSTVTHNAISGTWTRNVQDTSSNSEAQTAGEVIADPAFLGGASPTTADGFIPSNTALFRTGTKVGDYLDFSGCRFATPPSIGAYEMACGGRGVTRSSVTRTAISR